jgi:hypothetical protein
MFPLMKSLRHIHAHDVLAALTTALLLGCSVNLLIFYSALWQ